MKRKILRVYGWCIVVLLFTMMAGGIRHSECRAETRRPVVVQAPASPASVPLILACRSLSADGVAVRVFTNHSQAHALFIKGDVDILSTGLSVGIQFRRQNIPVRVINAYVTGLTYLVTREKIADLGGLRGKTLHIPFAGSPIDEVTRYFFAREGLVPDQDVRVAYSLFPASLKLLREGRLFAAALPEPYVSMIQQHAEVQVSLGYRDLWKTYTGREGGYPQVVTLVKADWAEAHGDLIADLNRELALAVEFVRTHPGEAADRTRDLLPFSKDLLKSALHRTDFRFLSDMPLKQEIDAYYDIIGTPLHEGFHHFFYSDSK